MLREAAYRLTQSARIGWFFTEYMLGRYAALSPEQRRSRNIPAVLRLLRHDLKGLTTRSTTGAPTFLDLLDDIRELMQRDLANIRAGIYGLPDDLTATPLDWLADARLYFADLSNVVDRRRRNGWDDIAREADLSAYPSYYRRNFHYQTGGYISDLSARLYDHQVEVLFFGAADAMRRQALVPLADFLRGRRNVETRLLDVGCGTGRFLCMLKHTYPRLAGLRPRPVALPARRATAAAETLLRLASGARTRRRSALSERKCRCRDLHLPVPRGTHGHSARHCVGVCPCSPPRRAGDCGRLHPEGRCAWLRRDAGRLPGLLPRALLRRLRPHRPRRALLRCRADSGRSHACLPFQGHGLHKDKPTFC